MLDIYILLTIQWKYRFIQIRILRNKKKITYTCCVRVHNMHLFYSIILYVLLYFSVCINRRHGKRFRSTGVTFEFTMMNRNRRRTFSKEWKEINRISVTRENRFTMPFSDWFVRVSLLFFFIFLTNVLS